MNIKCNPSVNEEAHSKNGDTTVNVTECLSLGIATNKIEPISSSLSLIVGASCVSEFESVHRN